MTIKSLQPGPHTSKRCKSHKIYPYLLRNLQIDRFDQVWETDINYIPMAKGFMCWRAVIDVYSRYVVNGSFSNAMDNEWVTQTIQESIEKHGCPEIIIQIKEVSIPLYYFSSTLLSHGIKLSMDGRGRAPDTAFMY